MITIQPIEDDVAFADDERRIREMLAILYDDYLKNAEPYLKMLERIYAMRTPPILMKIDNVDTVIHGYDKDYIIPRPLQD
jgi:hypothetical protein